MRIAFMHGKAKTIVHTTPLCYIVTKGVVVSETITVRCTAKEKQAIIAYARLRHKSVSAIVLESVLAQMEDAEDYESARMVANEPTTDIKTLANDCEFDYEKL